MKKHLSRLLAALLAAALLAAPASALSVDEALGLLEETYYYGVPEEAYGAQSLEELFQILGDPYTTYMDQEEYAAFLDLVESTVDLVGIGVEISYTQEGLLVRDVLSGGSALAGGLQPGDLIVAIDGTSCVPALEEHRQLMLGAEGTQVTVTVLRDGQSRDYTLTRRVIYIPNTEIALLEGGIGYVDCNSFGTDTADLMAAGLEAFDGEVNWWVLDLRDNAGGYVGSAIDMLAALNGPGGYLYFEDAGGEVTGFVSYDPAVTGKPLIVLVNGESASASELVSAGVRDTGRGILIGSRTFGKGVAQSVLDEETDPEYFDGDCLKVTTNRFYSAGGNTTDRIGVIPTLLVADGYTEAVAAALVKGSRETSSLALIPGSPFYVDPDAPDDVICALLEAIPPQVPVFYRTVPGGVLNQYTPAQVAELMGLEGFQDRWFSDVEDGPYAAAIRTLGCYQLLNGTSPGVFSPKEQLTRAQLCVMLARVLNVSWYGPSRFSDVAGGAWYAGAVNAMAELGLVDGVGGGRFDPDSPITQQQLLTILGRAARYINVALDAYGQQVDGMGDRLPLWMQAELADYAGWARSGTAVLAWGLADALEGSGSLLYAPLDSIDPNAPVLREEAAAGMYRLLAGLEILP